MNREEIFSLLQDCIVSIVPDVPRDDISPGVSLKQLGADSIDRTDIAAALKAKLGVDVSALEIGRQRDLHALVDLIHHLI